MRPKRKGRLVSLLDRGIVMEPAENAGKSQALGSERPNAARPQDQDQGYNAVN